MAIFCKTLLLLCTPEQRRGALKKDKSTVDELFGSGCFHSLGTHILLRIYDFAETKKKHKVDILTLANEASNRVKKTQTFGNLKHVLGFTTKKVNSVYLSLQIRPYVLCKKMCIKRNFRKVVFF